MGDDTGAWDWLGTWLAVEEVSRRRLQLGYLLALSTGQQVLLEAPCLGSPGRDKSFVEIYSKSNCSGRKGVRFLFLVLEEPKLELRNRSRTSLDRIRRRAAQLPPRYIPLRDGHLRTEPAKRV